MKSENYIQLAALMGALAVGVGAFGAHGLEEILTQNGRTETFETAVKYHFYHALGMLAVAMWVRFDPGNKALRKVIGAFLAGILIFSGSLYILSLTGITWLGAITPIGGLAFILGWVLLIWAAKHKKKFDV